jgi:glycosyltransferase involved in cell wall biosynthesis
MLSIVIPAYNEEKRIGSVVSEAVKFADELIVVDDGSNDETASVAEQHGARVVRQANSGHKAALKEGFREARGDICLTMDADGEHDPWDIPRLVSPIEQGRADLVLGKREHVARISERLISRSARIKTHVTDTGTGMRAMRTDLARRLTLPGRCICGTSVLEAHRLGARIQEKPIHLREVEKPRKIAWEHAVQLVCVIWWMVGGR